MTDRPEVAWGYRLEDGTEFWEVDHGRDGIWTPALPERGIPAIDLYSGQERDAISRALNSTGNSTAEVLGVSQPESDTDTH